MLRTGIVEKRDILYSVIIFFENCAVCEIKWKSLVEPGGPHVTKWRMRIVCCIAKITNISLLLTYILYECYKVIN
jgi:hypothetical protein